MIARARYLADRRQDVPRSVSLAAAAANESARDAATQRLLRVYPQAAILGLAAYYEAPGIYGPDRAVSSSVDIDVLLEAICALPRRVVTERVTSLDVIVKGPGGVSVEPMDLGRPIEMDSSVYDLVSERLQEFAASGGSIELRQFDRSCPRWSWIADDLARAAHADVYLKLFVAGGTSSVNGRHRDATDVLTTTLAGSKSFQIWNQLDTETAFGLVVEGGAAVIPRGADHEVTPDGSLSALLSAGLMRMRDWSFRGAVPEHLGFRRYPVSALAYALSLRSHCPVSPWRVADTESKGIASRALGGLIVNADGGGRTTVSACGSTFEMESSLFEQLIHIHEVGWVASADLVDQCDLSLLDGLRWLTREGVLAHSDQL